MKHNFEQRRQNRINYAQSQAAKNKQEADRLFQSARDMASVIPLGQPILVGHHSEFRDRRYRDKIQTTFGKSFEKQQKAAYYADKAKTIENNDAVSSDDPQALEKLTERVNQLKAAQVFMKAANQCLRKGDKDGFLKLELATESLWEELNPPNSVYGKGYPRFSLSNNNANIKRIEQRIASLQRQQVKAAIDKTLNGIRIFENREANRLQMFFEGKPDEVTRKQLKANGFRWAPSESAWQRQISNAAYHAAVQIATAQNQ